MAAKARVKSVRDIAGQWTYGPAVTGLIQRLQDAWDTPLPELSDVEVITFLNQNIATREMLTEAERRLKAGSCDNTELYEGQLAEAVSEIKKET